MLKKYLPLTSNFLLFATLFSLWLYPSATTALGITFLLFILAASTHSIFEKHKTSENPRPKIIREVVRLAFTMLLVLVIGGVAGLLVGRYAGMAAEARWQGLGMAAGLVSAVTIGLVNWVRDQAGNGKTGLGIETRSGSPCESKKERDASRDTRSFP